MGFKTDYARVHGHGVVGEGVGYWWLQCLILVVLILLTLLFLFSFASVLGGGYEVVVATYMNWWNVLIVAVFIIVVCWHLMQGLQVVIEDYVFQKGLRMGLLLANMLFNWVLGAVGVLAVAMILFSA